MIMKNTVKNILSILLIISMVIGAVPVYDAVEKVEAAEGTTYVLAGGDFQEAGDHDNSAANVTNILAQISQKYTTMDGFLFIGDYDCETHNDATETANGITALMGAVQGSYSNIDDANSVLVQGNHDYMDSRIDTTGGHEFDGYSAYVLNEDDYPNGGGSQSGIQALANNLEKWLNNKIGEGYDAPIFIVSHLPLAFTPRTVTQGDAKYAKYIFDVLNDAGENGLNIIFLHGHDHAYGPDNYMGGEAIYLPKGDKICVAEAGSTSAWTEETLNFTYMNAGYTGYYSDAFTYNTTAGTDKLTMTVFAITDNEVTVERYSANGLYNLKSAGYDGSYSNTSVTNVSLGLPKYSTVYASPQTIKLVENTADEMGTIGEYVGVMPDSTDDVKPSANDWVEIIAPVPGTDATPGSTTYKYVLDTDGVNSNTKYLIVNTSSAGTAYALTNNNGSVGRTEVTINDDKEIIIEDDTNINWIFSGSTSGTVVNQDKYIYPNNGSISLNDTGSNMTISSPNNGAYRIYRTDNIRRKYYLRYNNGFTATRVNSNNSTTYSIYLFAYKESEEIPGNTATPGTNGMYGKIDGKLTHNVTRGITADEAKALVMAGIDGYYYEAMSTPDSDVTGTMFDDGVLKWTLDPNYDGNVPGDYAVTISYAGVTLGTAEVIVPAATTYYIAEGNGFYLVDMNTSAEDALATVKAGITVSSATDTNGTGKTEISDDDVTWNWIDTYNGADSGPYTVEILKDGTSLGTVEVKVNIKYETGINTDWTYIGESEATGVTYTYTLDTDGIDYGEEHKYIIVDDNEAIVLNANSSSNGTAHSITIDGNTATTASRDYEYHFIQTSYNGTRYELITKGNGSQYLYQESNGVRYGTRSSVKFQINHHGSGVYDIHDIDGTNWYIIYNGGWTVTETTSARVRLYKYIGTTGGTPAGSIYAKIEGNTVYTVDQGTSATSALSKVKAGITGYISSNAEGSNPIELDDSKLTWKWKNTYSSMINGSYWVEVCYDGNVLGIVEVKVEPGVVNNYPEYPDEGAVKVNKTVTGIDFQSSGIAQVELSASGVPIKKGVDVILMLDTSSSMTNHTVTGTDKTRATVLEESLEDLIAQFKTPGDDGELLDIRVAIADFNGFYGENHNASGTPYDRDAADMMSDDISYNANSEAQVYTGDRTLGAGAFVDIADLAASYTLNYTSGTNYDYAMDAIYQMGTAIKDASNEERDLYVIFMSDGAAMQWNYYHSQGASSFWNNWITGAWDATELTTTNLNCTEHAYYYDEVDHNGDGMLNEHRMANAIKGDPTKQYEVIRKTNDLGASTNETNMYMVPGLGATMFSISFDAQADNNVTKDSMDKSIETLASEQIGSTQYYYKVTSADELTSAFSVIGTEIAYAANNARYVDQMGSQYNLQLETTEYTIVEGDTTTTKTLAPVIEVLAYDIYTKAEADLVVEGTAGDTVTEAMIGDRKGTSTLQEVVKFSEDGTKAYSNFIDVDKDGTFGVLISTDQEGNKTYSIADEDDNIIGSDDVIYAKTFVYNTSSLPVEVEGINIPTGSSGTTNELAAETFYWKMDTITTTELALRYYVYLEGSMEGTLEGGSYPTNEYATLYYDNYLGNPCYKDTGTSPVAAWKEANVSYAFYLVNENGDIVVNQTTGQTGSFANKVAVTNPVLYETVKLNNDGSASAIDIVSLGVLPDGYTLYDYDAVKNEGATYKVEINSNSTGRWSISSPKNTGTTYVTQYDVNDASAYSNEKNVETVGYDYTHTIVWFAVLWEVKALPDTVVVDYGLPVDISVLTNDMFGDNGKLVGIGAYSDSLNLDGYDTSLAIGFSSNYEGEIGSASIDTATGKVRYTLNCMQVDTYEKFAYAVNYIGTDNTGYYYDTVTVIPATSIYYEDNYVEYSSYEYVESATPKPIDSTWEIVSENAVDNAIQDEDRPGKYSLPSVDANNVYGIDSVYRTMSKYSLGSAHKINVNESQFGMAKFSFYGTGFDVISLTSNTTGTITVKVTDENGKTKSYKMVDTYYGYSYNEETGKWETCVNDPNALYQVPVIKISDLTYGKYDVSITAAYNILFDHSQYGDDGCYDFYLDAIRIYDPVNVDAFENEEVLKAYKEDKEAWPQYHEVRNLLLTASNFDGAIKAKDENGDFILDEDGGYTFTDAVVTGAVFIDGKSGVNTDMIADYEAYGPNNEVYLGAGQAIAFDLEMSGDVASVQIGVKSVGGTAYSKIWDAETSTAETVSAKTIGTATETYYDITNLNGKTIVVMNAGSENDAILSVTNIKVTYNTKPEEAAKASFASISYDSAQLALNSIMNKSNGSTHFTPEELKIQVDKRTVKMDEHINLSVFTSSDVSQVSVNGTVYNEYVSTRSVGDRIWNIDILADTIGKFDLQIVVFNEKGQSSLSIIETVNVLRSNAGLVNILRNILSKLKDIKVDVSTKKPLTSKTNQNNMLPESQNNTEIQEYTNSASNGTINEVILDANQEITEHIDYSSNEANEKQTNTNLNEESVEESGLEEKEDNVVVKNSKKSNIFEKLMEFIMRIIRRLGQEA